jgi:N-acetylneuraminic acid mutarotase
VLVTGGFDINLSMINKSELYDPSTGKWARTDSMHQGRCGHTATILRNGVVLVAGDQNDGY